MARIPAATRRLLLVPGRSRWPKLLMCSRRAPRSVGCDGAMQSSRRHRPWPPMQPRRGKLLSICSAESVQLRATIPTLLDDATAITASLWFVLNCRPRYEKCTRGWLSIGCRGNNHDPAPHVKCSSMAYMSLIIAPTNASQRWCRTIWPSNAKQLSRRSADLAGCWGAELRNLPTSHPLAEVP
jgi:hypothetical protein